MLTAFVWNGRNGQYGHASLRVDGGTPAGPVYISYWPADQGRELNCLNPGVGSGAQNFHAPAIRNRTID
jgi:hypothetical protein